MKILFTGFIAFVTVMTANGFGIDQDTALTDSVYVFEKTDSTAESVDSGMCVISGIFTVGENNKVPEDGIITVFDTSTDKLIGIYHPNLTTGKYLFILPIGKTYQIAFEEEGYVLRTENLIVPKNVSYHSIYKKINLGKW